jgi:DNA-binding transcriptional LysR family regulator
MFPGRLSDIDLRLLQVFKAVVDCGGLSAAQVELGIGLATISKHLTDLEERLNLRLCTRGRSGFALTEHGLVVHRATLKLLSAVNEFGAEVNDAHGHLVGELSVGVVDNTITDNASTLVERLRRFSEIAPAARLKLFVTSPNEIEVGVLDGRIQVGILPVYHRIPGLKYVPFYDETAKLYCSRTHELFERLESGVADVDLARHSYVVPGYLQNLERSAITRVLSPNASALHVEGVALLIMTGRYIGFLPEHYARQWCEAGQMKPLQPEKMTYSISMCGIVKVGPTKSRLVDAFFEDAPRNRKFSGARKAALASA